MNDAHQGHPAGDNRDAVLVVEDEQPLLEIMIRGLEKIFAVSGATSAKQAESMVRKHRYKVVISDHLMPGGNGLSLLVKMREEFPRMQRILMTGYMKPEMLLRGVNEAGLYRYLLKPISLPELLKTVQQAVEVFDQRK